MLFYSLYCDIISFISLKITQAFHLLLGFVENQTVLWDFKIQNSIRITEGSCNGDSNNRGPTVISENNIIVVAITGILFQVGFMKS